MGALQQAPRHSASIRWNNPSSVDSANRTVSAGARGQQDSPTANFNSKVFLDRVEDGVSSDTRCRHHLDVMLSNGRAVVHGVEGSHLIHAHGRHVQNLRDLVHGNKWDPPRAAMLWHLLSLLLSQVQERHDSRALVVAGVLLQDLVDLLVALGGEVPHGVQVVVLGVTMLQSI
eukprot:759203-Hanusia_phi.AAC.6